MENWWDDEMLSILTEPLIRMDTSDGSRVAASLPDVYAALMADEVEAFPALRPHQRHAWHAFLVQLGAMAMHKVGISNPPADPETWADLIRGLTPDFPDDEPWRFVVEDITKPAFMQPPASSEDKLAEYKSSVETPDELDMLVTSKNHDVKSAIALASGYDDLMLALISLQTSEGFSGAGNYGISRMNGGLGSRPAFSITPSIRTGKHVRRDIAVLLERRGNLLDNSPMREEGTDLLWTVPWDGAKVESLLLNDLDPLYIEVCRRIRLRVGDGGRLRAIRATTKAARVEAKALNGVTGDPWTPVDRGNGKSLTLAAGGFNYKRTVDYLVKWERPILCNPTDDEGRSSDTMHLVARGMVRGQGKTEGYHERTIPIRKKMRSAMLRRAETDDLGGIANDRIEDVGKVQRILSHAIQIFLARGEADKVSPEHRNLARPWLNRLDEIVDARFFDNLQTEFEADDRDERRQIRNNWLMNDNKDGVVDRAREVLDDAIESLPCPGIERYKARVAAEGLFKGRIRGNKGLPSLFPEKGENNDN